MDYLSELLESYNKLKKRTFKLVYLSEQEEALPSDNVNQKATQLAQDAINNAPEMISTDAAQNGLVINNVAQEPTALKIFKGLNTENQPTGNITVLGLGPRGGPLSVVKGEVQVPEAFDKLVARLSGEEKVNPVEKSAIEQDQLRQQEEAMAEAAKLEPGGLFTAPENEGKFPRSAEYIIIQNKIIEKIKKLCKEGVFRKKYGTTALGRIKLLCSNPENYIGGNYLQSLERKLVEGGGIEMYRMEGGEYAKAVGFEELDPDGSLIRDVLESQQLLVTLMGDEKVSQRDCAKVNQRISTFGGDRVVIYGAKGRGEAKRGVVIKATELQKTILHHFRGCDISEATFKGNTEKQNEDKGRVNEAIFQLGIELTNALKIGDLKGRKEIVDKIAQKFARMIKKKTNQLLDLANSSRLSEDVAIDTDSMGELQEIYGVIDTLQTPPKLKEYIRGILRKNMAAIANINAAGSVPYGRSQKLGLKTDTLLYFNTPDEAEAASKALGLAVTDVIYKTPRQIIKSLGEEDAVLVSERLKGIPLDEKIPVVNVGQKIGKGSSIRLGHVAFDKPFEAGRGKSMKGASKPENPDEYAARLKGEGDHSDFGITANNTNEETDLHNYSADLQRINDAATRIGGGDSSVWSPNGRDITSMTAQEVAEMAAEQLFKGLPVGLLKPGIKELGHFGTEIFEALLKTNPATGETEKVDFSDSTSRKRLQESMQRDWLSGRLHADLESDDPKIKRNSTLFVARIAQMGIMNMEEMAQLVVKEGGETFSFDQNAIVRAISKTTKAGTVSITPTKEGSYHVSFSMIGGDGKSHKIKITLGLQRSGDVAAWIANISTTDAALIGTPLSIPEKPQPENASIIYQYLQGQQKLLETLLNQTT